MATALAAYQRHRVEERAASYRRQDTDFAAWAAGYGLIRHDPLTQVRVYKMVDWLLQSGALSEKAEAYRLLGAADRIASAAMWLVVHMTYASNVYPDGRELAADDFKANPQGHTGGSLNMVPAYAGYLAANALTASTRAWMMEQGHCVAAIDACNLIVGNLTPAHAERYDLTEPGLTRLVRDFYSYAVRPDGLPESPLGSHVNVHTAGGQIEGGYLGFAGLQHVHIPLPGECLVAFLSDGAAEEQRGADWAPRWWRAEDCGLVLPIMIANGRRIDQRTTLAMAGGVDWLRDYLQLHRFDPIDLDGRDPAAFAWAVFEMEQRLLACGAAVAAGKAGYPVFMPYGIAETEKGYGFPGAGTNAAHGLPLESNPATDASARDLFNEGARRLWVDPDELRRAVLALNNHEFCDRARERDHPMAQRKVGLGALPQPVWRNPGLGQTGSPMAALDGYFCQLVGANPKLRVRLGNPDELRSNRMNATLDLLKHRVSAPEPGVAEDVHGSVITALNEEAVVSAALANKGGLNLVVTYEAFAVKMLGAVRQELIFARHQKDYGKPPRWLGVPLVLSSHVWENGKNEQSHQDPTLCEALLGEMADVSRVLFPADGNSAIVSLRSVYQSAGTVGALVVAKDPVPDRFSEAQAEQLVSDGALWLQGDSDAPVLLIAIGAYQLSEARRACARLSARGVANALVYILEPARFRAPRDGLEASVTAPTELVERLFPAAARVRVILTHTRPEAMLGVLRPLDTGAAHTRALGYINRGGTLDTPGMLFANRCTWAHAVAAAAEGLRRSPNELLDADELSAVSGNGKPAVIR